MLTTCQTFRLSFERSLPCGHFYRHVHNMAKSQPLPPQTSDYPKNTPTLLDPVPAICDALFEYASSKPWWYKKLDNHEDAICKADLTGAEDPRGVNALVSRYNRLGIPVRAGTALDFLGVAGQEPAAMKEYLRRWIIMIRGADSASKGRIRPVMSKIFQQCSILMKKGEKGKLLGSPLSAKCKIRERLSSQYFHVVTGYRGKLVPVGQRQACLFHLIVLVDPPPWKAYIWLVSLSSSHDGPTILDEWYHYEAFMSKRKRERDLRKDWVKYDKIWRYLQAPTDAYLIQARNITIRLLVRNRCYEDAWRIAYEAEDVAKDIETKTWAFLLNESQWARKWIPEMSQGAVDMLAYHLRSLEGSFGVKWVGGEDGYHVPLHDDGLVEAYWKNADHWQ